MVLSVQGEQASPENPMIDFPNLRTWAVVGVSADTTKYGYKIYRDLKAAGYHVYGINPKLDNIDGDLCYASLKELYAQKGVLPDVVDMVVPPVAGVSVVQDCLDLGLKRIWFQPGSESDVAIEKAQAGGMIVVSDACIMIQKKDWASV